MWIYRQSVLLTLIIEHVNQVDRLEPMIFLNANKTFKLDYEANENIQIINVQIDTPILLSVGLINIVGNPAQIKDVKINGLQINKDKLLEFITYRPNYQNVDLNLDSISKFSSHKTTSLKYNGLLDFNFFETDAIGFLLAIHNKIL